MNERIKELAEEAGGFVSLSHEHENKLILSGADTIEKFAELIVKECAKEAAYWWPADYYGAKTVEDRILQHFGVE